MRPPRPFAEKVKPGSWAESILDPADQGEVDRSLCPVLMIDYMGPSLDTIIFGISSGVWLFAKHPDEWNKLRESPSLIPNAVNEILRCPASAGSGEGVLSLR